MFACVLLPTGAPVAESDAGALVPADAALERERAFTVSAIVHLPAPLIPAGPSAETFFYDLATRPGRRMMNDCLAHHMKQAVPRRPPIVVICARPANANFPSPLARTRPAACAAPITLYPCGVRSHGRGGSGQVSAEHADLPRALDLLRVGIQPPPTHCRRRYRRDTRVVDTPRDAWARPQLVSGPRGAIHRMEAGARWRRVEHARRGAELRVA